MAKTLTTQTNYPIHQPADGEGLYSWLGHDLPQSLNNLTYTSPFYGHAHSPGYGGGNAGDCGWPDGPAILERNAATGSLESFIPGACIPALIHKDAQRFHWTINVQSGVVPIEIVYPIDQYAHDVVVDSFKCYISPEPYRGPIYSAAKTHPSTWGIGSFADTDGAWLENSDQAFDPTFLGSSYGVTSIPTPGTFTASAVSSLYAENVATDDPSVWMPFQSRINSACNLVFLNITVNRHSSDGAALNAGTAGARPGQKMRIVDFSWWVTFE